MNASRHLLLVAAVTLAGGAFGQTIYKLVDKNGKVTYSEKAPPKDYDGKVTRMDVNPDANTATLPNTMRGEGGKEISAKEGLGDVSASRARALEQLDAAKRDLDAAKKDLDEAIAGKSEEDIRFQAIKGGGTRPVETDEYKKRIASLQEQVKRAEERLKAAQREVR